MKGIESSSFSGDCTPGPPQPYYEDEWVTLFHGDCRDVLPTIERSVVDLVLTDPPYNAGLDYGGHDDSMDPADYEAWCAGWFPMVRATCARTIIFPGHGNLWAWGRIAKPSAVGVWHKPGNGRSTIIGWEEWEPWLYWTGDKGMLGGSTVIRAQTHDEGIDWHPCPKPLELMKRLLLKCKSAAVLDPFAGSGTALRAAKDLGIHAIGIELNERYCEGIAERLAQECFDLEAA